ncbi:MAG: hypothetical protein JWP88_2221 [Flaviaesturariibacter sp.]|nr:hypothetical protein [Flaviaesturariibacter sp.]
MKTSTKIWGGLALAAVTGIIIYKIRRRNTRDMLQAISAEGYETAQDILYPKKGRRWGKLHYGPVLPGHSDN